MKTYKAQFYFGLMFLVVAIVVGVVDGCSEKDANCPTTSQCGCSGKNQPVCASDCCKWVTGTGCVCK